MVRIASIDSGASKSDVLIYDGEKTVNFKRFNLSLNYHNISIERLRRNLDIVLDHLTNYGVETIVWGLAGLDSPHDYTFWEKLLDEYKNFKHHILHDVEMALYAGEPEGQGILIVSGTGSNVYGRKGDKTVKCGDWGALYGDDFSGYRIGSLFLNRILKIFDGRAIEDAELLTSTLEYLGISKDELPKWIYNSSVDDVAGLSEFICENAKYKTVKEILDFILSEMHLALKTVINIIGGNTPIYYTGGVFKCRYIRESFILMCKENGWNLRNYIEYPVIGGVAYYLGKLNYEKRFIIKEMERIKDYLSTTV